MLSPGIVVRRIVLRGRAFYVLHNPATGRYLRLPPRSWQLLSRLDGRRSLADALAGLSPPADSDPDDEALLRAMGGLAAAGVVFFPGGRAPQPPRPALPVRMLRGALITRVPCGDLMPVLRVAGGLLGLPFTRVGAVLVVLSMLLAVLLWVGRPEVLADQVRRISDPALADLAVWYLLFVGSKLLHECGHAVAARRMAAQEGQRIDGFPFGVTFMFLLPAPYVDVSATWFIASARRRAIVGLAGIWMDLCLAAVAACVAALIAAGPLRDRLCDLVMIAGLTSLLFNANPLVRLDGYYVLSDLLQIANLQARAHGAMTRLVGLPFGATRPVAGDAAFALYGIASLLYRFVIFASVFWLAGGVHWTLAAGVACVVAMVYLVLPGMTGLFALARAVRARPFRALAATSAAALLLAAFMLVPAPRRMVAHGVAWNDSLAMVFAGADGRVEAAAPAGLHANAPVLRLANPETLRLRQQLALEAESLTIEARRAAADAPQRIDAIAERLRAVAAQDRALAEEMAGWTVTAPAGAWWEPLRAEMLQAAWVRRDDARPLGALVGEGPMLVRLVLDQADGPEALAVLAAAPDRALPVRRLGDAATLLHARAVQARPDARDELPSPALALANGGPFALRADAPRTLERVFELRLQPTDRDAALALHHGQRVEVRFDLPPMPLAAQAWQGARRLFQQRLGA